MGRRRRLAQESTGQLFLQCSSRHQRAQRQPGPWAPASGTGTLPALPAPQGLAGVEIALLLHSLGVLALFSRFRPGPGLTGPRRAAIAAAASGARAGGDGRIHPQPQPEQGVLAVAGPKAFHVQGLQRCGPQRCRRRHRQHEAAEGQGPQPPQGAAPTGAAPTSSAQIREAPIRVTQTSAASSSGINCSRATPRLALSNSRSPGVSQAASSAVAGEADRIDQALPVHSSVSAHPKPGPTVTPVREKKSGGWNSTGFRVAPHALGSDPSQSLAFTRKSTTGFVCQV